jgi:hypothetical protein
MRAKIIRDRPGIYRIFLLNLLHNIIKNAKMKRFLDGEATA